MVGEPFERVADAGAINGAGADAADRGRNVKHRQRVGDRVERPRDSNEHAADEYDDPWPVSVDQPTLDRDEPGFGQDKDRERDLDGGTPPLVFLVDRDNKERPA